MNSSIKINPSCVCENKSQQITEISHSGLGYGINNKYYEFPPLMSDGRSISSPLSESSLNADLLKRNNIQSNWQYRQFLTHNSPNVIKSGFTESSNSINSFTPYSLQDTIKQEQPGMSDLKSTYLTREQLNARKTAPIIMIPK
jgi:hypothetical protein